MEKQWKYWQLGGFLFTGILGVLLHFAYSWSDENPFVAPFAAVNESIWEHMKLLYVPMFTYALLERVYLAQQRENYWCIKFIGITLALILIPVLYYSYTGIFGIQKDWINIAIFFVASALAFALEFRLGKRDDILCFSNTLPLLLLYAYGICFIIFTFLPPDIPLFGSV